jgi:PAS domain S-box-containing protein
MVNQDNRQLGTERPSKQKDKRASMEMHQMDIQRVLSVSLAATDNLLEGLSLCLETSLQISGTNCGGIFLFDNKDEDLNLIVHKGLAKDIVSNISKFEKTSETALLVKKGKPLYTLVEKLPMPLTQDQRHGRLRAFAFIPLFTKSNVIGCLTVSSTSFDEITMSSRIAIETIAAQAGIIIARLQANQKLHESEEHLNSMMQNAEHYAVYRLSISDSYHGLKVVFVSPSIIDIMGVDNPNKFESWFENIHPDDRERIKAANLQAFETYEFNEVMKIIHPDKKGPRWVHSISKGIISQQGELQYVNGVIIDITERKLAENELIAKEKELELKTNRLEEINTAMNVLLTKREEDKILLQERVLSK